MLSRYLEGRGKKKRNRNLFWGKGGGWGGGGGGGGSLWGGEGKMGGGGSFSSKRGGRGGGGGDTAEQLDVILGNIRRGKRKKGKRKKKRKREKRKTALAHQNSPSHHLICKDIGGASKRQGEKKKNKRPGRGHDSGYPGVALLHAFPYRKKKRYSGGQGEKRRGREKEGKKKRGEEKKRKRVGEGTISNKPRRCLTLCSYPLL